MKNQTSYIFFICFLLTLFFVTLSEMLVQDFRFMLFIESGEGSISMVPILKPTVSLLSALLACLLIYFAKKSSLERIVKGFFIVQALMMGIFAALFFGAPTLLQSFPFVSAFFVWTGLTKFFAIALTWSYANQTCSFKAAAIFYPIVALVVYFASAVLLKHYREWYMYSNYSLSDPLHINMAAGMSVLAMLGCFAMCATKAREQQIKTPIQWGHAAALAIAICGVMYASDVHQILFKMQLRELFPDLMNYSYFSASIVDHAKAWKVYGGIVAIVLGAFLYYRGQRALPMVLGIVVIGFFIEGGLAYLQKPVDPSVDTSQFEAYASNYGIAVSLVSIFWVLKELAFFGVDLQHRFAAKLAIDLAATAVPGLVQIPIASFIAPTDTGYTAQFMLAIVLALLGLYWMSKNLHSTPTQGSSTDAMS